MNLEQLTARFFELVAPDLPNSWEVEDAVEHLVNEPAVDAILAQVPVIWPVSNSLCYNYLGQVTQALTCIEQAELSAWVNETLDHYEVGGLRSAQKFMTDVERNYVCHLRGESGARLQEIQGWMLPYIQGLSGADLELAPARAVYTDTRTIYLPHELNELPDREDNILLYKLIAAYQWAFCRLRTFFPAPLPGTEEQTENYLQHFFDSFPDPALAGRLYHGLETLRAGFFLHRELPGLMRASERIRRVLHASLSPDQSEGLLAELDQACCLPVDAAGENTIRMKNVVNELGRANTSARDSFRWTRLLYEQAARERGDDIQPPLIFQGELHPAAAWKVREQQGAIISDQFVEALSLHLLHLPEAQKRVELGRALAMEPDLLLLDEPMAGMNIEEKQDMCRFVLDVNDQYGTTIALIEHDMSVVMDISDKVVVLDYGEKLAEGTPDEIRGNQTVIDAYLGVTTAN